MCSRRVLLMTIFSVLLSLSILRRRVTSARSVGHPGIRSFFF